MTKLPIGVSGVVKALGAGWTHTITHGEGVVAAQTFGPPRGDGTRPKLAIDAPCESIALRARHADGRAVAAVWCCRTDKAKRSWSMDTAWRGRHLDDPDEHAPRELTITELKAYVADQP